MRRFFSPSIYLKIASILTLGLTIGHSLGNYMRHKVASDAENFFVALMSHTNFDFNGTSRSYWDFHMGYTIWTDVILLTQVVLFWILSRSIQSSFLLVRSLSGLFAISWFFSSLVICRYFFMPPFIFNVLITLFLLATWAQLRFSKTSLHHNTKTSS